MMMPNTTAPLSLLKLLTLSLTTMLLLLLVLPSNAQSLPPPRYDGFVYEYNNHHHRHHRVKPDTIRIEAFLDPVCPNSRDAWPPLKRAVKHYGSRVHLVVHVLPLPYHDNACNCFKYFCYFPSAGVILQRTDWSFLELLLASFF